MEHAGCDSIKQPLLHSTFDKACTRNPDLVAGVKRHSFKVNSIKASQLKALLLVLEIVIVFQTFMNNAVGKKLLSMRIQQSID